MRLKGLASVIREQKKLATRILVAHSLVPRLLLFLPNLLAVPVFQYSFECTDLLMKRSLGKAGPTRPSIQAGGWDKRICQISESLNEDPYIPHSLQNHQQHGTF